MFLIVSENTDVYFNLAAEEYILRNFNEDVLMLWRSKKAVVCGKHQNLCAEVNFGFCKQNNIQIARRITGGGTVFHDLGNINFSYIQNLKDGLEKAINFRQFLNPVRDALLSLGVQTEYSGRNDLLLNGKKISGNAEHIFQQQKRVLHHGTLLFDTALIDLKRALQPEGIYIDKAVKSVRSDVTNIKSQLPHINADEFLSHLTLFWEKQNSIISYKFTQADNQEITKIATDKYSTDKWTLHYSPKYSVAKSIYKNKINHVLNLEIQSGRIELMEMSDDINQKIHQEITTQFTGMNLNETTSNQFLKTMLGLGFIGNPYILY